MELTGAGLVISCSQDATIRIWSLTTGQAVRVIHIKLHIQVDREGREIPSDTAHMSLSHIEWELDFPSIPRVN